MKAGVGVEVFYEVYRLWVDFKIKMVTIGGKRLKLTIWDTAYWTNLVPRVVIDEYSCKGMVWSLLDQLLAGQERFGTLTSSYYRGAHGIILVYDVTRRETFTSLSEVWAKEVELYSTNHECIKILVGNKLDRDSERAVTREEGMALAEEHKCAFLECSAKTRENVHQCFKDLILKILEVPTLLEKGSAVGKKQILQQKQICKESKSNALFTVFAIMANGIDIFMDWNVSFSKSSSPFLTANQRVITINGMFPGPLINATTDDVIHVNVFNFLDEPLLFTWNGIQQRLNSWQDGVSGTNCPILPTANWTYVFLIKDQIGTFFYFPSIKFLKAAGGYGPIRINNNMNVVDVPFLKPEAEFDLLIGDWYAADYRYMRNMLEHNESAYDVLPATILMNGKAPCLDSLVYESFTVEKGKTYMFRISNVGSTLSLNFQIENHTMLLVETEGSYTNQITLNSLDIHVGQSYSVLVTADQNEADFYMVARPKFVDTSIIGLGVLHYSSSTTRASRSRVVGHEPDVFQPGFSIHQAISIRWNLTAGAARPVPQGSFNVTNVTLSQTFILQSSRAEVNSLQRFVVNNISYQTPYTPLKLADHLANGTSVYKLDSFPIQSVNAEAADGISVVTGNYRGWLEIVFENTYDIDSWHLDGYSFFVVGYGNGNWTPSSREDYNIIDPIVRSTIQVYPAGWTAVYVYLDNPGMWNLRSQNLMKWYMGEELYIRVYDADPNPAKEQPPPDNLLRCGIFK
ncbi:Multicopper oxidase, type 1 [Corchorus olitorius]|uniref:Multicopper oxidase, type 1 n=1 Tax=Corchorus olitorius TaxID=93759 RepID=A0A1R3GXR4_9ROSI|nr:Multicopper oxidase, type 1 [Corchorus olitorius]